MADEQRQGFMLIYAWVAKALVLQAHPRGFEMTNSILGLFDDAVLAERAVQSIEVIIKTDEDHVLSKESFATVRV